MSSQAKSVNGEDKNLPEDNLNTQNEAHKDKQPSTTPFYLESPQQRESKTNNRFLEDTKKPSVLVHPPSEDLFNPIDITGTQSLGNKTPSPFPSPSDLTPQPSVLKRKSSEKKWVGQNYVKSRCELLEFENDYYENLRSKIIRKRHTKIIATVNQDNYKSYEQVRNLFLAGANSFLINMAYCEVEFIAILNRWRKQLEKEFGCFIPLTCVLKGSLVRIGQLSQPEIYLRKGEEFRIIIKKKIAGDSHICSVDDDLLIKRIGIGAKLLIDYGQVGLTVKCKEKSNETLKFLQENFGYGKSFKRRVSESKRKKDQLIYSSSSDYDSYNGNNNRTTNSDKFQAEQEETAMIYSNNNPKQATNIPDNQFIEQLKSSQGNRVYDVIVCTVDSDCMLKSYKPIFIYKSRAETEELFYSGSQHKKNLTKTQQFCNEGDQSGGENEEEYDECSEQIVSAKDITDISSALNEEIDTICVSNVHTPDDIKVVRKYCVNSYARIIAKIQTLEGVQNFSEILRESDGVLIARGYLTVHIPVEKLQFKQREMIKIANDCLKPVLISCNILDSMVSSQLPTTCEVGEISNLVSNYVDGIILSGETSYGMHPVPAIETLSRICVEAEARQVMKEIESLEKPFMKVKWMSSSVGNGILRCTLEAAYSIQANLIIVFTSSGNSALKVSKLRPPCPVIAFTPSVVVARQIGYLSSISGMVQPQGIESHQLMENILAKAKEQQFIKETDFVIVTCGEGKDLPRAANSMCIIQAS